MLANKEIGDCVLPGCGSAFRTLVACLSACGQRYDVMDLGHDVLHGAALFWYSPSSRGFVIWQYHFSDEHQHHKK